MKTFLTLALGLLLAVPALAQPVSKSTLLSSHWCTLPVRGVHYRIHFTLDRTGRGAGTVDAMGGDSLLVRNQLAWEYAGRVLSFQTYDPYNGSYSEVVRTVLDLSRNGKEITLSSGRVWVRCR